MDRPLPLLIQQLRARRLARQITLSSAARQQYISESRLSSWEMGARRMVVTDAYMYAGLLDAEPELVDDGAPPIPLEACAAPGPDARKVPPIVRQLRAGRLARELPPSHIADRLGVQAHTVWAYEHGGRYMSVAAADAYAAALGYALVLADRDPRTAPSAFTAPSGGGLG